MAGPGLGAGDLTQGHPLGKPVFPVETVKSGRHKAWFWQDRAEPKLSDLKQVL